MNHITGPHTPIAVFRYSLSPISVALCVCIWDLSFEDKQHAKSHTPKGYCSSSAKGENHGQMTTKERWEFSKGYRSKSRIESIRRG